MKEEKLLSILLIGLFIILSVYLGTVSLISTKNLQDFNEAKTIKQLSKNIDTVKVIYDGLVFQNQQEVENYLKDSKYANVSKYFDWSDSIPDFLIVILGACSFGLLGSVLKILSEHVFSEKKIFNNYYVALPLLSFLSGFVSIGISYLLPNVFLEGKALVNPVGLILFSLLFGFFSKEFFEKISSTLFPSQKQKP